MTFHTETFTVGEFYTMYVNKVLDLNPPYQRNPIWSIKAQQELIETILTHKPIPCFFLWKRPNNILEVVDGKQRALAIFAFYRGHLTSLHGRSIQEMKDADSVEGGFTKFQTFPLLTMVITALSDGESIESYYALVNRTGLRLNAPELRKAEFYSTNLLRLVTNLASNEDFKSLGLFTQLSSQRMNDVDFTSELVAQMLYGVTDKKDKVDDLFTEDIQEQQFGVLRHSFLKVVTAIKSFSSLVPISKTRYRQKNDFYTLFGFIYSNPNLSQQVLDCFYKILVRLDPYIRPSQDKCDPLKEYAYNCVTQSNSKAARENRLRFLDLLLLNRGDQTNGTQIQVLAFFKMSAADTLRIGEYLVIDPSKMQDPEQSELPLQEQ